MEAYPSADLMTGIDTNVLVRFLVADDPRQAERAHAFLARSRSHGEVVYVSAVVLCEAVWVLRSVYRQPRLRILQVMETLLGTDVFQLEAEDAVRAAIQSCRKGKGDFADHLIAQMNLAKGCRGTVTFDRSLGGAPGFTLL
jgi:predicted nucleic-acid-binding protein